MSKNFVHIAVVVCLIGLAYGWVKDVDNYAVKRSPDKIEKLISLSTLQRLLMWNALKFPRPLGRNYFEGLGSNNSEISKQKKRNFSRWSRMKETRSGGGLDPLASGLIG